MGIAQIIPNVTFPSSIARVPIHDPLESPNGMVIDLYPGASWLGWAAGAPAGGELVPSGSTVTPPINTTVNRSAAGITVARTSKGAIRAQVTSTGHIWFESDALGNYLMAHSTDTLLLYAWVRSAGAVPDVDDAALIKIQSPSQWVVAARLGSTFTAEIDGATWNPGPLSTGRVARFRGRIAPPTSISGGYYASGLFRNVFVNANVTLYRLAIVNQTLDGRSIAELDDAAERSYATAFGPGGVYYNDVP